MHITWLLSKVFCLFFCGACGGKLLLERSLQPCLLVDHITAEAIIAMLDKISFIIRFPWFFNKLDWVWKVNVPDSAAYNEKAIIYDEKPPRLRPNETSSSFFCQVHGCSIRLKPWNRILCFAFSSKTQAHPAQNRKRIPDEKNPPTSPTKRIPPPPRRNESPLPPFRCKRVAGLFAGDGQDVVQE